MELSACNSHVFKIPCDKRIVDIKKSRQGLQINGMKVQLCLTACILFPIMRASRVLINCSGSKFHADIMMPSGSSSYEPSYLLLVNHLQFAKCIK
jgi:hypothetical protein